LNGISKRADNTNQGGAHMDDWIGYRLKYYREKQNLTIQQLADLSNVDRSSISHAETNPKKFLSLPNLIAVMNALKINFSDLENRPSKKQALSRDIKSIIKNYTETELNYVSTILDLLNKANEVNNEENR